MDMAIGMCGKLVLCVSLSPCLEHVRCCSHPLNFVTWILFPSYVAQAKGESFVCVPSHFESVLSGLVVIQGSHTGPVRARLPLLPAYKWYSLFGVPRQL